MKKWSQYLLTNYPLIWNTRAYLMLPAIALLHLLYFLLGYSRSFRLSRVYYNELEADGGFVLFTVLLALLLLIVWLAYYFRNNGLKSFYPTTTRKLIGEYLLLLAISIGLVSFVVPYHVGSVLKFNKSFNRVQAVDDANKVNIARGFLAFDFNDFYKTSNCDYHGGSTTSADVRMIGEDTIPDSLATEFSYLNYCNQSISFSSNPPALLDARALHINAHRWLTEGKKDSVKNALNEYLKVVTAYGGAYHLNADQYIDEVFATPGFRVKYKINTNKQTDDANERYIEIYGIESTISSIYETRHRSLFREEELFILMLGICGASTILSFRITRIRTWFIALIGTCIWAILFGLLGISMHSHEGGILTIYLMLCLAFIIFAHWNIAQRSAKTEAGISFIWFQWSLPSLLPCLFALIKVVVRFNRDSNSGTYSPAGLEGWIDDNWSMIWGINITVIIAVTTAYILPLSKRWQAMPEE